MKVVMGGEALIGDKTGIGHYTDQLSRGLLELIDEDDFRFYCHGRLVKPCRSLTSSTSGASRGVSRFLANTRSRIAANRSAVRLHNKLMPYIESYALKRYQASDVFHSPNYTVPRFPGRKIVTILDLSTIKFPEFHPAARVEMVNKQIHKAVREADHIITITERIRAELIDHFGLSSDRISTTHLGANSAYRPIAETEFESPILPIQLRFKQYFFCAATLEPRKNLSRLIDAHEQYAADEGKNAMPLILSGHPGWSTAPIHKKIQAATEQGRAFYLGYVSHRELANLVAGARALLYPSIYEGFGLPVLEAMQSGTAVLSSRGTAMEEVAADAALFVSPSDTDDIANGIRHLASDNFLVEMQQVKGLKRAADFSWARCATETMRIYQRMA